MLSSSAREAARRRGGWVGALVFLRETARESGASFRRQRAVALRAAGLALVFGLLAGVSGVVLFREVPARELAVWSLAAGAITAGFVAVNAGLFRGADGLPLRKPGPGNGLTLLRFVLIGPLCVLLAASRYGEALAVYALLVLTDVVDGIVARARGETSVFGVVMDPLADVFSTFAVFTVFLVDNLVPLWLYLVLVARYAMLLLGSLLLFAVIGPLEYRSTIPGKVVGVVQAAGAGVLMWGAWTGGVGERLENLVFGALGIGFASVIVSQGVLGWRHIRRSAPGG